MFCINTFSPLDLRTVFPTLYLAPKTESIICPHLSVTQYIGARSSE